MDHHYRCYFLDSDNKFADFADLICASDPEAIAEAQRRFAGQRDYVGFELWEGTRRVYTGPSPSGRS